MASDDHWIYQGRQEHGWFGNGTAPDSGNPSDPEAAAKLFNPAEIDQRTDYVAHSAIGHLPPAARGHSAATFSPPSLARLRSAVRAWHGTRALTDDAFHTHLLGRQRPPLRPLCCEMPPSASPVRATTPLWPRPVPILPKACRLLVSIAGRVSSPTSRNAR